MRIIYHHRTQGEEPESIHILAIISALKVLGHELLLVGPSRKDMQAAGSNAGLLSAVKRLMPAVLFEIVQIIYNIIIYLRLSRQVREFRPAMIYERYALYSFAGILVARRYGIPLILEVNTPYAHAWARYYKIYFPRLARRIERWILNSADRVITVTGVQKQFLVEQGVPAEKIVVCQNAIDPDEFDPAVEPWRFRDGALPTCKLVIGFVGTMNRWQGIPVFKDIIARVLEARPDVCFLMVGDGEFRAQLESDVTARGHADRVLFTGRIPHADIPSLVRHMDITVLPNSNDHGSPMKVFEYMAMGKAVIAPRVPPVEEILRDGETGLIVEPCNVEDIVRSILQLVDDPVARQGLSDKGREYVLQHHTWVNNAATIVHLYEDVTAQAGKPA